MASIDLLERLSMIRLDEEEKEALSRDVKRILEFFSQLDRAELEGVEPLFHVMERGALVREDVPEPQDLRAWVMASAARTSQGHVVGPRTIG